MAGEIRRNLHIRPEGSIPVDVTVRWYRGATLKRITQSAMREVDYKNRRNGWNKYDLIYMLGGVNDLTSLLAPGYVTPVFKDYESLLCTMSDRFEEARNVLRQYGEMIILGELVGIDLNRYNRTSGKYQSEQLIINRGVPMLNNTLNCMNRDMDAKSPWLGDTIHTRTHGRLTMRYGLLKDGVHAVPTLKTRWAKLIIHSFNKNINKLRNLEPTCNDNK